MNRRGILAALFGTGALAVPGTMRFMPPTLADMLPGVAVAERGGVVELAELQAQGWSYVRP